MIVIVSNKQKAALDNANIDAIKDLNGLFNVQDLINNFKNYFFTKMVIDATSIVDFTNPEVLKQLANGIGSEKLIVLLPPKPEPPLKFLETLVNIGIYNFSTNIDELVRLIENPYDYDAVNRKIHNVGPNNNMNNNGANNMPMNNRQGNNNPDRNMNRNIQPQSAAKKDIINLSDLVLGEVTESKEEVNDSNSDNKDQNNVKSDNGANNPFDSLNQVTPIEQVQQENNDVVPEQNNSNNDELNYENTDNTVSNTSMYNNVNNSSFLNGGMSGEFIGFSESKGLIVGFRNVTEHAGTTTLLYKMKETIENRDRKRVALVEVGTNDFMYFRLNDTSAISENELDGCLKDLQTRYDYVFVDLNNVNNDSLCDFVLYLVEPSKIKINQLIVKNRNVFNELKGKYVVLNKSLLTENEKGIFSQEANLPFYASVGPFNDREATNVIDELINKIDVEKNNVTSNMMGNNQSQGFLQF